MKLRTLLFSAALAAGSVIYAQLSTPPGGGNQKSVTKQYLGSVAYVEITYNSPDVAGREGKIWGGVVPYGLNSFGFGLSTADNPSPWRAGANENTTIEFSHDMKLQGKDIAAGKYGFHVITQESGPWTIILTTENEAWGSFFYHPDQDVLKVEATPEDSDFREYLTFEFTERLANKTTVALKWEKKSLPFVIEANTNEITLAKLESELNGQKGFNWNALVQAANWASGAGYHDHAEKWAEAAISAPFVGQKNYTTLSTKAGVQMNQGKVDEAIAVMDVAIKDPGAQAGQIHQYGRQLITAGKKEKALEVFKYNRKRFEGIWPTNYGLARGYSAVGNYKQALKYLKIAQGNVPANDTQNPPLIAANIEKLEKGEDIN